MPALAFVLSSVFKEHHPGQEPGWLNERTQMEVNTSALTGRA